MWWIFLLIPIAFILLILFLKVRLCVIYEDELSVYLKVLCFKFSLYPQKTKKIKPKNFSIKNFKKRKKKLQKKDNNQQANDQQEKDEKDKSTKIKEIVEIIKIILDRVILPFSNYLKVEIVKIYIKIASSDASKTAMIYGLVSQSTAYIIELLSNITNVDVKSKKSINVVCDFLSDESDAKINITFSLRCWHAISLALKFFTGYLKIKNNDKT